MKKLFSVLLVITLFLTACGGPGSDGGDPSGGLSWQEQYDLGVRYLSDGNYREAIIAFTAAIEIEPRADLYVSRAQAYILSGETEENLAAALADYRAALDMDETYVEAWLGLADVYIRQGEYEKAMEALREGLEKTGDPSIADKIAELESGNVTDSAGHLRRMSGYDADGNLTWYHTMTYDEQGRESSATSYDAAGNQMQHIDKVYDENGKVLVGYTMHPDDGTLNRIEYERDSQGRIIKNIYFDKDGPSTGQELFQYDSSGNRTQSESYNVDGVLLRRTTYEYDSQGREIKSSNYNSDGELLMYYMTEYNDAGKSSKFSGYSGDGQLMYYNVYVYDEQGKQIGMESYDGSGNLQYSTVNES